MITMDQLNSHQRRAVEWGDGHLLVLGGPGSGRTTVLRHRALALLTSETYRGFMLLARTETTAHAVRESVKAAVDPRLLRRRVDHYWTLKAFAQDTLEGYGRHIGVERGVQMYASDEDRIAFMEETGDGLSGAEVPRDRHHVLRLLDGLFSESYRGDGPSTLAPSPPAWLPRLFRQYCEALVPANRLDPGAVLHLAARFADTAWNARRVILETGWQNLLVEDYEEISRAELDFLRLLIPVRYLFVVADPERARERRQGDGPSLLDELRRDYEMETIRLPQSYRCPPVVISAANVLLEADGREPVASAPSGAQEPGADGLPGADDGPSTGGEPCDDAESAPVPATADPGKPSVIGEPGADVPDQLVARPAVTAVCEPEPPYGDAVRQLVAETDEEEGRLVGRDIRERGILPGDCAVLGRADGVVERVADCLRGAGLDVHVARSAIDFVSPAAGVLLGALRLSDARHDRVLLRQLCRQWERLTGAWLDPRAVEAASGFVGGDFLRAWVDAAAAAGAGAPVLERIRRGLLDGLNFPGIVERFAAGEWMSWDSGAADDGPGDGGLPGGDGGRPEGGAGLPEGDAGLPEGDGGRAEEWDVAGEIDVWRALHEEIVGELGDGLTLHAYLRRLDERTRVPAPGPDAIQCISARQPCGLDFKHVYVVGLAQGLFPTAAALEKGPGSREMAAERWRFFSAVTSTHGTLTLTRARVYGGRQRPASEFLREIGLVT